MSGPPLAVARTASLATPIDHSAFLGIDETIAASHDLIISALCDGGVHLHPAVALAGNHLGRPARAFRDFRMIKRRGNGIAINLARFLDRGFPQFETAIGAGRSTSGGEQELAGIFLVIGRLDLGADRVVLDQGLEIIETASPDPRSRWPG